MHPKEMVLHDATNEHPMAVPISVALADNKDTQSPGDKNAERQVHLLLCPDFKAPTAVAASSSSSSSNSAVCAADDAAVPRLVYSKDHSESLHPFWAVRRITNDALQQSKDQITKQMKGTGERQKLPQFNCQFVTRMHNCLSIAEVGVRPLNSTRLISVPYESDELIVQHFPRVTSPAPKKRAPTWRDVQQAEVKKKQKAQTAVAAAKATAKAIAAAKADRSDDRSI